MSNQRYTPEFRDVAARKIVDRGYSAADVSKRLGVSAHSLYKWIRAIKPDRSEEHAAALIEAMNWHWIFTGSCRIFSNNLA